MTGNPPRDTPPRVVIVGGGIAGLSAAHALRRLAAETGRPIEIVLLEASSRTGGNIRSESLSGYLCEWGPNGFLDSAPATLALIESLGLQPRVLVSEDSARRRFIYRRGRLRRVPDGVLSFLSSDLLSLPGKIRVALEPFVPRRRPGPSDAGASPRADGGIEPDQPSDDETIHAFAVRRIGREAADVLISPMVSGIFGGDARMLSLAACFPRMAQMENEHGGLTRALLASRKRKRSGEGARDLAPVRGTPSRSAAGPGMPTGRLTSFQEGMEELARALTVALGPIVRTGMRVERITTTPGGANRGPSYHVAIRNSPPIDADAVLLSTPSRDSASALASLDADLGALVGSIASAPLAVLCFGFEASSLASPLDGFGFLVAPGEGPRILGALWDSSIYAGRAPQGKVLIRAMIGGGGDRDAIHLSDPELIALARRDLATVMAIHAPPSFTRVFRHPLGIPQYTVGHLRTLRAIEERLNRHPGVILAGNSYRGVSINACIAEAGPVAQRLYDAVRAVRAVRAGRGADASPAGLVSPDDLQKAGG